MKKRYASFAVGSALLVSLAFAPLASFAATATPAHAHPGFFAGLMASFFERGTPVAHADTPANAPPSISGISAPTVLRTGETGTWSVSASDPQNGSLSYSVNWGEANSPLVAEAAPAFVQTSTFTHAYMSAGTYTVRFTVRDDAGLTNTSSVTVYVTGTTPPPDLKISDVDATVENSSHAAITWITNIPATSKVFYTTTLPVNSVNAHSVSGNSGDINHRVELTGLAAGTTYYYVARSRDDAGEVVTSSESSFTTPVAQNLAPTISSFTGPASLAVNTQGTWTVQASDPRNEQLTYAVNWGDESFLGRILAFVAPQIFTQTTTFNHTYSSGGTYTVTVTAKNAAGLRVTATTNVVVNPSNISEPVLSNVAVTNVGNSQATLSWNTDENADSSVWIGTSPPNTSNSPTGTDSSMSTSHSLTVQNLSANTTYFAVVGSRDANGNLSVSSAGSFTTSSTTTNPPTISNITALVSENGVTFNWNTDESADSEVYYSTNSPVVIGGSNTTAVTDATRVTDHSTILNTLSADTTYHFIIQSKDANGATTATPEFSLTTMGM